MVSFLIESYIFPIKSFYVKFERKIPDLVDDFCRYYAEHRNKTVVNYYDATALGSNYAVNNQDFHYNVVKEFEQPGWRVESVNLGNPMHTHEKYLLINNTFADKQRLMPFFNRENNDDLILAIQNTGVSCGRNGFTRTNPAKNLQSPKKTCSNIAPTAPMLSIPSISAVKSSPSMTTSSSQ